MTEGSGIVGLIACLALFGFVIRIEYARRQDQARFHATAEQVAAQVVARHKLWEIAMQTPWHDTAVLLEEERLRRLSAGITRQDLTWPGSTDDQVMWCLESLIHHLKRPKAVVITWDLVHNTATFRWLPQLEMAQVTIDVTARLAELSDASSDAFT